MKKLLSEPLFHFFIIALAFFAIHRSTTPNEQEALVIDVSNEKVAQLQQHFFKTWQREPTQQEITALVRNFTLDEIYYREAMALGLGENDNVIRRRLRQKMEVMVQDISALNVPTEQKLNEFYQDNINQYSSEPSYSFKQVYISFDNKAKALAVALQQAKIAVKRNEEPEGDSSLLPTEVMNKQVFEITRLFGRQFSTDLESAPLTQWYGPIKSNLGFHFVNLIERSDTYYPPITDIKQQLINDWRYQQQKLFIEKHEKTLLNKYQVVGSGISNNIKKS